MPKAGATVESWILDAPEKSGRGAPESSSPPLPEPRLLLLIVLFGVVVLDAVVYVELNSWCTVVVDGVRSFGDWWCRESDGLCPLFLHSSQGALAENSV